MWQQQFSKFVIITLLCLTPAMGAAVTNLFVKNLNNEEIALQAKSSEMRNFMNASHDPCDDFYSFTCGNYDRLNPTTELRLEKNIFQTIVKSLSEKISKLLETDELTDSTIDKTVKNYYKSCVNADKLQNSFGEKLKAIISEFGHMPALEGDKWQESQFDWLKTVAEISHRYNIHLIVGYFIHADNRNNRVNRMRILMQDIPLKSSAIYRDYVHEHLRELRKNVIVRNLKQFLGLEEKLASKTAKEIFEFETHLFSGYNNTDESHIKAKAKSAADDKVSSQKRTNLLTLEEMQHKYFPVLDIKRLVNISLGSIPTEPVYDLIADHFENLAQVLQRTPKRTLANYIFYYLVEIFMFTPPKERDVHQELCVKATKEHFAKLINNMIYRKYISSRTQQDVQNMWHTIKATFHNVLESNKLEWMTKATRQYALGKLKNMRLEINAYQQTNFSQEYGQLTLNKDNFIENTQAILSLSALQWRSKLNAEPTTYENPLLLSFSPVYIYVENLIKVPVSILLPNYLWSDSYPYALKFGTLGFLIAHELIHGFDEYGRTYDKTGNKNDWWDLASSEYFQMQTQCFSAQYHEYIYDGIHLPQLESQAENTADNGGIRLAYTAYLRWYKENLHSQQTIKAESMPHLLYNYKQLFFISYGQMWCNSIDPSLRKYAATIDDHVPANLRVLGPLSNLVEFSQEFNCPAGSHMNPKGKCFIY